MRKLFLLAFALLSSVLARADNSGNASADQQIHLTELDGLPHRHVTKILQDADGFIWMSTWNGLVRYDGRAFVTFKSGTQTNGVELPSDRFRVVIADSRNDDVLYCLVEKQWFAFSRHTGQFSTVSAAQSKALARQVMHMAPSSFNLTDRQGVHWHISDAGVDVSLPRPQRIDRMSWTTAPSEVKWISCDRSGWLWVSSKQDKVVRVYARPGSAPRYLAPDGRLSSVPVAFSSSVYCMYQSPSTGNIWLGCKPAGLYRLSPAGDGFHVTHITQGVPADYIYDIKEDKYGRLWMAGFGTGVVGRDKDGRCTVIRYGHENKVRRIEFLTPDILAAATTEGLLLVDIRPDRTPKWILHRHDGQRPESLSSNPCMDILQTEGRIYISTESGGINEITSKNLFDKQLSFRHYDTSNGLGRDVILAMTPLSAGRVLAVSSTSLIVHDTNSGESYELTQRYLNQPMIFSEARPIRVGGRWFLGLNDGLAFISDRMLDGDRQQYPIVLTSMEIGRRPVDFTVTQLSEVTLDTHERNINIHFACLDFRNFGNVRYAYRLGGDQQWHYLGDNNSVALSALAPGTYDLELRSTNAMGRWNTATRHLTIHVQPKFVETLWFQLLMLLLIVTFAAAVLFTRRYVCRMKAKQKELLDAYLSLIEKGQGGGANSSPPPSPIDSAATDGEPIPPMPQISDDDRRFMERVQKFVEEHIADSDVNIEDMAAAVMYSRSNLNRKMKSLFGLTPADFMREARLKRAAYLLLTTRNPVSNIAYECGFTDPKYFSRVFRSTYGVNPSEYRENRGR